MVGDLKVGEQAFQSLKIELRHLDRRCPPDPMPSSPQPPLLLPAPKREPPSISRCADGSPSTYPQTWVYLHPFLSPHSGLNRSRICCHLTDEETEAERRKLASLASKWQSQVPSPGLPDQVADRCLSQGPGAAAATGPAVRRQLPRPARVAEAKAGGSRCETLGQHFRPASGHPLQGLLLQSLVLCPHPPASRSRSALYHHASVTTGCCSLSP